MPALPTLWGASPLDADDLSRLLFTVDVTPEILTRDLDNTPTDFGTMDTGLGWVAQWATNLASGDDAIGAKFCITNAAGTVVLAGGSSALPSVWADPGWTQIKNRTPAYNQVDQQVSGTFAYVNTTATKADWDGAVFRVLQSIDKNMAPDGCRMEIDFIRTNGGTYTAAASGTVEQTGYRIRTGDDQGLNVDAGWAAALNTAASLPTLDLEVRIRFQVSAVGAAANFAYEPWVSHNAGAYTLVPNNATPWVAGSADGQRRVMIVPSAQYANADPTTELLAGSGTFVAGEGRETEPTGTISLAAGQDTEIEFCFLIRKWSEDGHVPDGDTFDFRLRKSDGTVLDAYGQTPRITITNRAGHIGAATPETPARLGIEDPSGNLYVTVEACDISGANPFNNELIVVKSTDGGDSWLALDLGNRPGTTFNDVEASDIDFDPAAHVAHVLWQGPNSNSVYYVQYRTAGHATTPDTYGTVETVDNATSIPASGAHRGGQGAAIAFRPSDGAAFAFYKDGDGTDDRISYRKRTSGGAWDASPTDLDGEANVAMQVAFVTVDSNNVIHIIYVGLPGGATDGTIWHRSISTGDVLSARTRVNDVATLITANALNKHVPHAPPVIYQDGATEKIGVLFIDDLEDVYYTESPVSAISFTADALVTTTSVWTGGGASNAATIALAVDDSADEPVAMWTPNANRHTIERDVEVAGSWGTDAVQHTGTAGNEVAWLRTLIIGTGAGQEVGIVSDEHPDAGGTGGMFFDTFAKPVTGQTIPVTPATELDVAQPIGASKQVAITAATEAAAAQPIGVIKVVSVGAAGESDSPQSIAAVKQAGILPASETNAAQPITRASGPQVIPVVNAGESNTAQPVGIFKQVSVTAAAETDTGQPVSAVKAVPVAPVSETDTAQPVTATKAVQVDPAAEVDTAQQVDPAKQVPISAAAESDAAQPVVRAGGPTLIPVAPASESDAAQPIGASKTVPVAPAAEVDTAQLVDLSKQIAVAAAAESDAAQPISITKQASVSAAAEIDTGQPVTATKQVPVTAATETDTAQPVAAAKAVTVDPPTETDTAQPVTRATGATLIPVAPASESDAAQPMIIIKQIAVDPAAETDTAQPVGLRQYIPVAPVSETDTAQQIDLLRLVAVAAATSTELAVAIPVRKTVTVSAATETETAQPVTRFDPFADEPGIVIPTFTGTRLAPTRVDPRMITPTRTDT